MPQWTLVTGANRGLGLEFVRQSLASGAHVVAACRQPGRATALNALAGEYPGRLRLLPLDVTDARSRDELVRELPLAVGDDGRIDRLINNAGVLHSGERFGHLAAATLDDSLQTNVVGPLLLTQALAPWLVDGARVANLSSTLGSIASTVRFGTPSYAISKAALNMATVQLACALADRGIVVVALHPGWVRTDMGGEQADLDPAQAVAGLLARIDALGGGDSGRFLDADGRVLPW
ncbi:SDR family oxidoreductase [Luteimonas sp. BDR2-5]|uniref:SDR family oxidoreductase n=1 Tax=Proluteimonas luteida TaxID=2878685 RepID=UPI001E64225F|nr:SDR family oxidoreductase [Luteimonas sp. BDR2-5]MCD9027797.1 SDR family oxidoreductase [Luteimonas sp. BDR2-5]